MMMRTKRMMFLFFVALVVLLGLAEAVVQADDNDNMQADDDNIPPMLSPFGSYLNPLQITVEQTESFHPVLKFPKSCWNDKNNEQRKFICNVGDYTKPQQSNNNQQHPLSEYETFVKLQTIHNQRWHRKLHAKIRRLWRKYIFSHDKKRSYIGRYDENRIGMYESDLFTSSDSCPRTLHIGIDLAGHVGQTVYSFDDGIIHQLGYNPEHGDYGHVIIIEYNNTISTNTSTSTNDDDITNNTTNTTTVITYYALYGHLDNASIRGKHIRDIVYKGQIIGFLGDIHENGGWNIPHVHFQLSTNPPQTHDMPGAICINDRLHSVLQQYPDPRIIVGKLY